MDRGQHDYPLMEMNPDDQKQQKKISQNKNLK